MKHPTPIDGRLTICVRVIPRSSRNEIAGFVGNALKIKLTAPPVEGAANEHLIIFLAKFLAVNKSRIRIVSGQHSREKVLAFEGLTAEELERIKALV